MYLFFEESKRGGVSSAMKMYSEANNKYMKNYDPEKPSVFIEYLDKNGLYTSILAGPLPFSGFRWLTEEQINEMMYDHTKIRSCTLRVDLEYPKELHDLHNEYPLAVESIVGGRSEETNPEPSRQEKIRGTSRSSALLPEKRDGFEENSRGNVVRGAGLHEKVNRKILSWFRYE